MNWIGFYSTICTRLLHFMVVHHEDDKQMGFLEWQELFDKYDAPDGDASEKEATMIMRKVLDHHVKRAKQEMKRL